MYKYTDSQGRVHYSLKPPPAHGHQLEWVRAARKVVRQRAAQTRGTVAPVSTKPLSGITRSLREEYETLIAAAAHREGLAVGLVHAVIRAESGYDPKAVSRAGARGLMQLMPATAERFGVKDSFDPAQNVRGGTAYLKFLLRLFENDLELALAGYNAGEGAVLKHGRSIPPYPETQAYVRKVREYLAAEQDGQAGKHPGSRSLSAPLGERWR